MVQSWNRQQLDGQPLPAPDKLAAARARRDERKKVAEQILSKPKRKDTNKPRG